MKKLKTHLACLASVGIVFQFGQICFADDLTITSPATQTEVSTENSSGSVNSVGQLKRASDILGATVQSETHEKIGTVNDLVLDLQSGRVPFVIVSSGGFFGVGDRLTAVPAQTFSRNFSDKEMKLVMQKSQLQSAPNFDKNNWPDMNDQAWSAPVYGFYGEQPYPPLASSTRIASIDMNEPAGAERSTFSGLADFTPRVFGETTTGLSQDRTPRQGLGSEDLTKNEQKIRNPDGYAASDSFIVTESAGAEPRESANASIHRESSTAFEPSVPMTAGKVRRASDLIGMEIKNAQGERVGEIKDVVLDLQSGRITYAVLSAGGFLGMSDRLYAVPPSVLTRGSDERTLILNTDKEMLKAAPSFDKNNWSEANNQKFTSEVYRYYHQKPYSPNADIREPSGGEWHRKDNRDSSGQWQRGNHSNQLERTPQIQEPSGAQLNQSTSPAEETKTPQTESQSQGSAAKEAAQLESSTDTTVREPAGAATSVQATREDQTGGTRDKELREKLSSALETDPAFATEMKNIQISATNGRLTLRGSVSSEEQKQAMTVKAQEIAGSSDKVDNQLQVKNGTTP